MYTIYIYIATIRLVIAFNVYCCLAPIAIYEHYKITRHCARTYLRMQQSLAVYATDICRYAQGRLEGGASCAVAQSPAH